MNKKDILEFVVVGSLCVCLITSLGTIFLVESIIHPIVAEIIGIMTVIAVSAVVGLCGIIYLSIWNEHLDLIKRFPDSKKKK